MTDEQFYTDEWRFLLVVGFGVFGLSEGYFPLMAPVVCPAVPVVCKSPPLRRRQTTAVAQMGQVHEAN